MSSKCFLTVAPKFKFNNAHRFKFGFCRHRRIKTRHRQVRACVVLHSAAQVALDSFRPIAGAHPRGQPGQRRGRSQPQRVARFLQGSKGSRPVSLVPRLSSQHRHDREEAECPLSRPLGPVGLGLSLEPHAGAVLPLGPWGPRGAPGAQHPTAAPGPQRGRSEHVARGGSRALQSECLAGGSVLSAPSLGEAGEDLTQQPCSWLLTGGAGLQLFTLRTPRRPCSHRVVAPMVMPGLSAFQRQVIRSLGSQPSSACCVPGPPAVLGPGTVGSTHCGWGQG